MCIFKFSLKIYFHLISKMPSFWHNNWLCILLGHSDEKYGVDVGSEACSSFTPPSLGLIYLRNIPEVKNEGKLLFRNSPTPYHPTHHRRDHPSPGYHHPGRGLKPLQWRAWQWDDVGGLIGPPSHRPRELQQLPPRTPPLLALTSPLHPSLPLILLESSPGHGAERCLEESVQCQVISHFLIIPLLLVFSVATMESTFWVFSCLVKLNTRRMITWLKFTAPQFFCFTRTK